MSEEKIKEVIATYTTELKRRYDKRIEKVILYGSCARGDFTEFSDIDILVLINDSNDHVIEIRRNMRKVVNDINWEYDVLLSPVYQNYNAFHQYMEASGFYQSVDREGVSVG